MGFGGIHSSGRPCFTGLMAAHSLRFEREVFRQCLEPPADAALRGAPPDQLGKGDVFKRDAE